MTFKTKASVLAWTMAAMLSGGVATASAAPDLVVTSLSGPAEVELGEYFPATVTLANQGVDDAPPGIFIYYSVFISTDTVLDSGDVCAGYGSVHSDALTAGQSDTDSLTLLLNASNVAPATYNLIAEVDRICGGTDRTVESDETNNALTGDAIDVLVSTAQIDLTITDVDGPTHVRRGEFVRPLVYMSNLGPDPAPGLSASACGYYVGLYLSTDPTITTSDTLMSRTCMNPTQGGESRQFNMDVTIPANFPRGFYYWGAIADDTSILTETDETNNAGGSQERVNIR